MVDILPFRGIRYNTEAAGAALDNLVAPPYDVISPAEQDALYAKHPANVVRLILGREDDKYAQAGRLFREWLASGVLTAEDTPAMYVYRQTFDDPGTGQAAPERVGLVCLMKLEPYGAGRVLPHEKTLTGPKQDRLELLQATEAQFESIYGLFSDPDSAVRSFIQEYDDREAVVEQVDGQIGATHKVERIADADAQAVLKDLMSDKIVFIADGHHRYETALNYQRRQPPSDAPQPADYLLVTLTAFEDEGLLVLPTHRLVHGAAPERIAALPAALEADFALFPSRAETLDAEIAQHAAAGKVAFGVVLPPGSVQVAVLKTGLPAEMSAAARLPASLLASLILDKQLGIDAAAVAEGKKISYTRDAAEAVQAVRDGDAQAAFLLGRPSVADVEAVSLAGDVMPQKSTFFFPKLLSGLVMRDLRDPLVLDQSSEAS